MSSEQGRILEFFRVRQNPELLSAFLGGCAGMGVRGSPRKFLKFGLLKWHFLHSDKTIWQNLTVLTCVLYTTFYDFLRTCAFECFLLLLETTF